jgi:two-component system CheB/CheR fusion protein
MLDENIVSIISGLTNNRSASLIENLCLAFDNATNADHIFMATVDACYTVATTEVYVEQGVLKDDFTYELKGTPCSLIVGSDPNSVCAYNGDVQACFPDDQLLIDMGINSYVGVPLISSKNKIFGIIVALFKDTISHEKEVEALFKLFSGMIAGDLERQDNQQQLNVIQSILGVVSDAVVVANDSSEIILCNQAFTNLSGYSEADAIGQSASLLKSGEQDTAFYQSMWDRIERDSRWEGEVINKKKSGELFPDFLRINKIYEPISDETMYVSIHSDISELKQAKEEAHFNKNYHALTHLPNRQLFLDRVNQYLYLSRREKRKVAIVTFDLDGYHSINSLLGHESGDVLLVELSKRMKERLRSADSIAHFSSDEFGVCLPMLGSIDEARKFAESLQLLISEPFDCFSESVSITASIGIAIYPNDARDPQALLEKANEAMVLAKADGKSRYHFYTKSMHESIKQKLELKNSLLQSLHNEELKVAYQPIISNQTGQVVKLEALARWSKDGSPISPAEFVPIAEEGGFCSLLGNQVLQQSCQLMNVLNGLSLPLESISVNRSIAEFNDTDDHVNTWQSIIGDANISATQISFEVTESLLAPNQNTIQKSLYALKDFGSKILLDDFGTGYSSLSYLRGFPIDYLKIDRSFVSDIDKSHEARGLVAAIIAMSKALGIKTIAEGIETKEQLQVLQDLSCDYFQGFYFSKPLFQDELIEFLTSYNRAP